MYRELEGWLQFTKNGKNVRKYCMNSGEDCKLRGRSSCEMEGTAKDTDDTSSQVVTRNSLTQPNLRRDQYA
jgi:biotin-(acetyl-CoA carboxylase) ligase